VCWHLQRLEAEHAEENRAVRVEPGGWDIPELAGDDGRVEHGELVEARHGRNLEASSRTA
jgi:hypothetical protein